ncbi:MAG: hypothetical protein ACOYYU_12710 [Chloroflexota bacterium]
MRPGIGHDLEQVAPDPKYPRRQASEAELLARMLAANISRPSGCRLTSKNQSRQAA